MTIYRSGIKIVLSPEELIDAYYEQQHKFDVMDVKEELSFCVDLNDGIESKMCQQILEDDGFVEEIANDMRRMMDEYDCELSYARSEAIKAAFDVLSNDILSWRDKL